tara:strand:- start:1921 stop:2031 length:111 start_codon:yes stop_codon:yes gene_type:complete
MNKENKMKKYANIIFEAFILLGLWYALILFMYAFLG